MIRLAVVEECGMIMEEIKKSWSDAGDVFERQAGGHGEESGAGAVLY